MTLIQSVSATRSPTRAIHGGGNLDQRTRMTRLLRMLVSS